MIAFIPAITDLVWGLTLILVISEQIVKCHQTTYHALEMANWLAVVPLRDGGRQQSHRQLGDGPGH